MRKKAARRRPPGGSTQHEAVDTATSRKVGVQKPFNRGVVWWSGKVVYCKEERGQKEAIDIFEVFECGSKGGWSRREESPSKWTRRRNVKFASHLISEDAFHSVAHSTSHFGKVVCFAGFRITLRLVYSW